jgi:hypothetical protein
MRLQYCKPLSAAIILLFIIFSAALVMGAATGSLFINGRASSKAPLEKDGEYYIPLSALKAAGAEVSVKGNEVRIRFEPVTGGTHQADAVEGRLNEWLFNGIWRVKVTGVAPTVDPFDKDRPGYKVTIECRNGSTKTISQFNTGMKYPQLFDEINTKLTIDENGWQTGSWFKELPAGGSVVHDAVFYYPHGTHQGSVKKPAKLLILVDVNDGLLKGSGLKYTTKAPSFRITF